MASGAFRRSGLDQASRLRALVHGRSADAHVVAVTSGKGGVGKSSVAVNMSICLSLQGFRVTLIDVDMGMANADVLLNIQPRYTLSHVLSGIRGIADVVTEAPGGVRFVPGVSGVHELADMREFERQHLIAQLQKLESNTDIIVLDCGAGIGRTVLAFALSADRVIVVTTPQPTAMTDAYATIKALHHERVSASLSVFVNMAQSRTEADEAALRLSGVAGKFLKCAVANAGYMLHDTAVEAAVRARCPFVIRTPGSNASACIAALATEVSRRLRSDSRRGSFFGRVAGLFV